MKTEFMAVPSNWKNLVCHPLAEVVAFGVGIDVNALAAHIKTHGYDDQESIIIYRHERKDVILDGRHKHAACIMADVTPSFRRFVGKSPEAYVAKKAFRQHLNTSQRALIAATISNATLGNNQHSEGGCANLHTLTDSAETMNVSRRSAMDAKKVITTGTEELKEAVADGTVSVSDAAKVADEPATTQKKAIKNVRKGKAKTLSEQVRAELDKEEEPKELTIEDQMKEHNHRLESFCRKLQKLVDDEFPKTPWLDKDTSMGESAKRKIKDAITSIRSGKCSHICPSCKGDGCRSCLETGFVTQGKYQQLV